MVEDFDLDRLQRKNQGSRENLVMLTGLDVPVGVIMGKDNGGCLATKGRLRDSTRVNSRAIDSSLLKRFHSVGQKLVGRVEIPNLKDLVRKRSEARPPERMKRFRLRQRVALFRHLLKI